MLDTHFRTNSNDWNCPKCNRQYNEETFRNLQKHCNRKHHISLSRNIVDKSVIQKHTNNRIIKHRLACKKLYRKKVLSLHKTISIKRFQCVHITRFAKRCKQIVIGRQHCRFHLPKTKVFAAQHGVFLNDVSNLTACSITIQPSTLPDKLNRNGTIKCKSGNGVFAQVNFQSGDFITEYTGDMVSNSQYANGEANHFYFLKFPSSFQFAGINGLQIPGDNKGVGSFINCGYKSTSRSNTKKYRNNTRFHYCSQTQTAWIIANKYIPKHKELFIDYGPSYIL